MKGESGARHAANAITIDDSSLDQRDLELGYQLGYQTGYDVGWAHGWNACDDELQAIFGLYRSLPERKRHAELDAIRNDITPRCQEECGGCSACARHAQAVRNWYRYRSPDYPGQGAQSGQVAS